MDEASPRTAANRRRAGAGTEKSQPGPCGPACLKRAAAESACALLPPPAGRAVGRLVALSGRLARPPRRLRAPSARGRARLAAARAGVR